MFQTLYEISKILKKKLLLKTRGGGEKKKVFWTILEWISLLGNLYVKIYEIIEFSCTCNIEKAKCFNNLIILKAVNLYKMVVNN